MTGPCNDSGDCTRYAARILRALLLKTQRVSACPYVWAAFGTTLPQPRPAGKQELTNVKFAKLCRECKVVAKGVTAGNADVTFERCKQKGARSLDFDEFQAVLAHLARPSGL